MQVSNNCKLIHSFCSFDLNRYQNHSFRMGVATFAVARGFSDIQAIGRWKSTTEVYPHNIGSFEQCLLFSQGLMVGLTWIHLVRGIYTCFVR